MPRRTKTETGSHGLAGKSPFIRRPKNLDTRGNNYELPIFPLANPNELNGKRVLIVTADGAELPELAIPLQFLRERGAEVLIAGQDWIFQYREPAGLIVVGQWLADEVAIQADLRISDVDLDNFDAVFIPGGAWNPDMLRTDETALNLIRRAHHSGVLVVTLCHGPQAIINAAAGSPFDRTLFPSYQIQLTGTHSIIVDLENAGFCVIRDQATVYDDDANLLTARDPNDLGPLCLRLAELLCDPAQANRRHWGKHRQSKGG